MDNPESQNFHKTPTNRLILAFLGFNLILAVGAGIYLVSSPGESSLPVESVPAEPEAQIDENPAVEEKLLPDELFTNVAPPASPRTEPLEFDGQRAYEHVAYQVGLGPRLPGSRAHAEVVEWIKGEMDAQGWQVEVQEETIKGQFVRNILAKCPYSDPSGEELPDPQRCSSQSDSIILIGAHYDSRFISEKDPNPDLRTEPVLGANDGASGVAVLLELARTLPKKMDQEIWLVFFDAEDNGAIEGWDWILGSTAFVDGLDERPQAVVILDMIGDADLNIYLERNSNLEISTQIWETAADLGYEEAFIPVHKYSILDDHTPFLNAGIPAVDVIDFDYPYHHTSQDTLDKVSAESLEIVGHTILTWLLNR